MGKRCKNSIVQNIIDRTNIFGIGHNFSKFKLYPIKNTNNYSLAEFLTGIKIIIGDIFNGGKVLSITGNDIDDNIEVCINPIVYNKETNTNVLSSGTKILNFRRTDFAILKIKRD